MGIEETIRSLGSVVWPGKPGPDSAKPRSAEGRPRAVNPTTAQTPKEALTYIERLHKTGRMEDLATLLRRSPVFREAWLTLQQSRPEGLEASGGHQPASPSRAETSSLGNFSLPSPATRPPGPLSNPDQSLAEPKLADSSEFIRKIPAAAINPTAQNYPVPSAKPTRPFTAARQIYETQQRYFAQGKDQQPQINVRV